MLHCRPLCVLAILIFIASCDQEQDGHTGHDHNATITEPGVWPPVMSDMENEQALQGTALAGAKASVIDAMRAAVLNNPQVKQALGNNYREFEASLSSAKSEDSALFLFYNYDTNTTVEASFAKDGTVSLSNTEAARFQPSEHAEEVPEAIAMARDRLITDGYQLDSLTGTAMLAHPPVTQIQTNEQTFYGSRVLYVTFGPGDGQLPHYSALVDLSSSTVTDARLIN